MRTIQLLFGRYSKKVWGHFFCLHACMQSHGIFWAPHPLTVCDAWALITFTWYGYSNMRQAVPLYKKKQLVWPCTRTEILHNSLKNKQNQKKQMCASVIWYSSLYNHDPNRILSINIFWSLNFYSWLAVSRDSGLESTTVKKELMRQTNTNMSCSVDLYRL